MLSEAVRKANSMKGMCVKRNKTQKVNVGGGGGWEGIVFMQEM
jgi:hypothetical protein